MSQDGVVSNFPLSSHWVCDWKSLPDFCRVAVSEDINNHQDIYKQENTSSCCGLGPAHG